jgi:hypothetical protein
MTAYTPNLPALITALPGDHTRAPQTEFTRARQVLFLENLSVTGSVRSAAAAGGVSHQTAYRARRSTPALRTAWDAALVVARAAAADTLACRAIDGIEEKVFYHGEEVATRTRYSDRLLLAHLARLDRLVEDPRASAFAEDWDASLARFEAGEAQPEATAGMQANGVLAAAETQDGSPGQAGVSCGCARAGNLSDGPCNTRSMSYSAAEGADGGVDEHVDDGGEDADIDWDGHEPCPYGTPEDHAEVFAGESAYEARLPLVDRLFAAMDRHRPANAPRLSGGFSKFDLQDEQLNAFVARVPEWWLVVPPRPGAPEDEWCYASEAERGGA